MTRLQAMYSPKLWFYPRLFHKSSDAAFYILEHIRFISGVCPLSRPWTPSVVSVAAGFVYLRSRRCFFNAVFSTPFFQSRFFNAVRGGGYFFGESSTVLYSRSLLFLPGKHRYIYVIVRKFFICWFIFSRKKLKTRKKESGRKSTTHWWQIQEKKKSMRWSDGLSRYSFVWNTYCMYIHVCTIHRFI